MKEESMHPTLVVMFMDAQRNERERRARSFRSTTKSRGRTARDERR
jgi:hypothetical protein